MEMAASSCLPSISSKCISHCLEMSVYYGVEYIENLLFDSNSPAGVPLRDASPLAVNDLICASGWGATRSCPHRRRSIPNWNAKLNLLEYTLRSLHCCLASDPSGVSKGGFPGTRPGLKSNQRTYKVRIIVCGVKKFVSHVLVRIEFVVEMITVKDENTLQCLQLKRKTTTKTLWFYANILGNIARDFGNEGIVDLWMVVGSFGYIEDNHRFVGNDSSNWVQIDKNCLITS